MSPFPVKPILIAHEWQNRKMITLYTDRRMINHKTPAGHPERPERLAALLDHWEKKGHKAAMRPGSFGEVTRPALSRIHSGDYLDDLEAESPRATDDRPIMLDPDTHMALGTLTAARLAAGAAVAAVDQVMKADANDRIAFCAVRPPGHHARAHSAMGFCIFSTIAVAAAHARDQLGLERILIVDFDVHHGNGTQEIFYDDNRVGFVSIHRHPFYPGTGKADESGRGRGAGFTWNAPLGASTSRTAYHSAFEKVLETAAEKMRPQLVLISAGFDAHKLDPVGGLNLETEDFGLITKALMNVANTHCGGRIVSLLEGGYNVDKLVESATLHIETLGCRPESLIKN
jgi:acetoin utilization deacetylase AcuC-like enzyme